MKQSIIIISILLTQLFATAQVSLQPQQVAMLQGYWLGSLTYLDYSSGKPYTMPANLDVQPTANNRQWQCGNIYPNEPKANYTDTIMLSEDGKMIDGQTISIIKKYGSDSLKIVAEKKGIDGNDNKPATLRYIYLIGKNSFSKTKMVRFMGTKKWIQRHVYSYQRTKNAP